MKYLLALFLLGTTLVASAQKDRLNWLTDFEKAKKKSEKTEKPIVMYFTGSDWCAPCKMLHLDFFATKEFKERSKELVLLKIDIPRRVDIISEEQRVENNELVKKYNTEKSFPTLIAINHKGKVINSINGYSYLRDPSKYFLFVDSLLKK